MHVTSPPVRVRGAVAGYDGVPVLHGVDLDVDAGEVVAVLGANGSGKSTLVKAVVGLMPLTAGTVELFGEPLERFRAWRRVGYVPQRVTATGGVPATVGEVVASGRLARMSLLGRLSRQDRAAIDAALQMVGLADRRHSGVERLSGGQQQRVLIARALASEPDLLVLDEPTAGVDLPSQQVLAHTLAALRERGISVLLVAHELGPLLPIIDRAVVMRGGHVRYNGPLTAQLSAAVEADLSLIHI
jgi:zinc transport system ATP-binding protein